MNKKIAMWSLDVAQHFDLALTIDPKFTRADRSLSKATKYNNDNPHLQNMQNKLKDQSLIV